jgi:hypothetical protein
MSLGARSLRAALVGGGSGAAAPPWRFGEGVVPVVGLGGADISRRLPYRLLRNSSASVEPSRSNVVRRIQGF